MARKKSPQNLTKSFMLALLVVLLATSGVLVWASISGNQDIRGRASNFAYAIPVGNMCTPGSSVHCVTGATCKPVTSNALKGFVMGTCVGPSPTPVPCPSASRSCVTASGVRGSQGCRTVGGQAAWDDCRPPTNPSSCLANWDCRSGFSCGANHKCH